MALGIALQFVQTAAAQPLPGPREQITKTIAIIRGAPDHSWERENAGDLLVSIVRKLDLKAVDESLIDEIVSMLDDPSLLSIAASALQPLDQLAVTRKAIPKLLEVLPEEECREPSIRIGHFASDDIRFVLEEMGVQGRKWLSEGSSCPGRSRENKQR